MESWAGPGNEAIVCEYVCVCVVLLTCIIKVYGMCMFASYVYTTGVDTPPGAAVVPNLPASCCHVEEDQDGYHG